METGSELLPLVPLERSLWTLDHELGRDSDAFIRQKEALQHFSRKPDALKLCFVPSEGREYLHWFVTDGIWCIGFMSVDDDASAETPEVPEEDEDEEEDVHPRVQVQRLDPRCEAVVRASFTLTEEVLARMERVCGGINHSFCLRNSEHLAKYIHCGSWASLQMNEGSLLRRLFQPHLESTAKGLVKLVNTLPKDIRAAEEEDAAEEVEEEEGENDDGKSTPTGKKKKRRKKPKHPVLFPQLESRPSWVCHYESSASTLARVKDDAWNVLFVGPSGAGKSRIINVLFNREVTASAAAGRSVTVSCEILRGKWRGKKVNVIDTIGFSNSEASPERIVEDIKAVVKNNVVLVDVVVFVVAERIAEGHQKALKECLKWLHYSPENKARFVFLYNKGDTIVSDAEKMVCLTDMGRLLGVDVSFESKWLRPDGVFSSLPLARVSAFPPNPPRVEDVIGEERDLLMGQVFGLRKIANCPRIHVSTSACNIL